MVEVNSHYGIRRLKLMVGPEVISTGEDVFEQLEEVSEPKLGPLRAPEPPRPENAPHNRGWPFALVIHSEGVEHPLADSPRRGGTKGIEHPRIGHGTQ